MSDLVHGHHDTLFRRDLDPTYRNLKCNDSDGLTFCSCMAASYAPAAIEDCMFYGRNAELEPLAFSLQEESRQPQSQSPLFSTFPGEIRNLIFEYALTDCTSNPYSSENRMNDGYAQVQKSVPPSDIAFNLLQTCRAVYLETYQLPLCLNPVIVYDWGTTRPSAIDQRAFVTDGMLAPWQFALIQGLDISLQQVDLEGSRLSNYLDTWKYQERHEGAVVVPRFYSHGFRIDRNQIQNFAFHIVRKPTHMSDGESLRIQQGGYLYSHSGTLYPMQSSRRLATARAMVARPLTHLTLRLTRKDWWTWTDKPSSAGPDQSLGLDPACGDGSSNAVKRPTADRMLALATNRRVDPTSTTYSRTWGATIGKMLDLESLTLVLQTFDSKRSQLETVVECAKTWRFPLDGCKNETEKWELVWDGQIEEMRFTEDPETKRVYGRYNEAERKLRWQTIGTGIEVRVVKFRRRKVTA